MQDVRLADVYTFRDGKAIQMRAFADRDEALRWLEYRLPRPRRKCDRARCYP